MKNKVTWIYVGIAFIFVSMFLIMAVNGRINFKSLGASVSTSNEQENIVITATRKMVEENIDNYDGEVVITVKELISNNYLSKEDLTKDINKNDRVIIIVENKEIKDIYIKSDILYNKYKCKDVCYYNEQNYVAFNNDVYRIIKTDNEGYIYITNNKIDNVNYNNIKSYLKKEYNKFDKDIVEKVITLSVDDINNSDIIELEDNVYVFNNNDYQVYNIVDKTISTENITESNILPIIVLKDVTYEIGNGTEFNPYVIEK